MSRHTGQLGALTDLGVFRGHSASENQRADIVQQARRERELCLRAALQELARDARATQRVLLPSFGKRRVTLTQLLEHRM